MPNLAFIITGQIRTFFNINTDLKNALLRCKKHYEMVYVICILNSNNSDDYNQLSLFFNNLDIKVQIIDYTKYSDEYMCDSFNKINSPEYIKFKESNLKACLSIKDPDGYSIRHTWIQYHQLKIGITTLDKYIRDTGIDFNIVCKTRFDSKYPTEFFPHIPSSTDALTILSFDAYNKDKILESMEKYNIKDINDIINFNKQLRLRSPHIPIEHSALCFGGRVCYNYKSIENIIVSTDNIMYSFNDYYFFSNKNTFMKLVNIYGDSCLYSNDNPDLSNHTFCPEAQLMIYCLNNNIDIIMYPECFYDTMVYR
jgi:hypothetical protein